MCGNKNTTFQKRINLTRCTTLAATVAIIVSSCSISKQIGKQANRLLLGDSVVVTGHTGISIYDIASDKYLYNYNAEKYFVPASNTKLFSLYAGLKYLGDSLVGIRYQDFNDSSLLVYPTGDPTFLHPDFISQPVLSFLQKRQKNIYISNAFADEALGDGWSWNDYNDNYMVERNALPIFGNTVRFKLKDIKFTGPRSGDFFGDITPSIFKDSIAVHYILPLEIAVKRAMQDSVMSQQALYNFSISRQLSTNVFAFKTSGSKFSEQEIPFATHGVNTASKILKNIFGLKIIMEGWLADGGLYPDIPPHLQLHTVKSQPSDSLFKPMMYNSDNFFAEQTLLMASNEHLGFMNDEAIIDTLLKTDLKDIPQKPRWVDGSGLSRYNLFTPKSFVFILNKMKNEFGLERMKRILPTGGQGTTTNYYKTDSGYIFAKTGSLGNQSAFSGYLITRRNKLLIFSILNSNFQGKASLLRRAIEKFLKGIREKY